MFGRRPDGRRLDDIDPIVQVMPYVMVQRNDAMNMVTQHVDYEPLANYIKACSKKGVKISFMDLVVAAYVRAVSQYPSMNRFIINKQVFARNEIKVSLTVLRNAEDKENMDEALVKMTFQPTETVFEVAKQIHEKVDQAVRAEADNSTVDFARVLVKFRLLVMAVVAAARLLDRYGLLPRVISELSPFHCSMFITNMASIGMPAIYHHTYNFGNTSMFIAMGKFEREPVFSREGVGYKTVIPMGVVTDERICGGAAYAQSFTYFKYLLSHPEELETPPETVKYDFDFSKRGKKGAK